MTKTKRDLSAYRPELHPMLESDVLIQVPRKLWPPTPATIFCARAGMDHGRYGYAPKALFLSKAFLVQVYNRDAGYIRLTISSPWRKGKDWADGLSWEQLMEAKRQAGFGAHWAVECYPADSDIVNVANMRHLWLFDAPAAGIGWSKRGSRNA